VLVIGHERDSTVLDDIAHRRFDTPSKVAHHITTTIKDNVVAAATAFEQITLQVARILDPRADGRRDAVRTDRSRRPGAHATGRERSLQVLDGHPDGILRSFGEKAPILTMTGVSTRDHAALTTRAFNRSKPARPNICRLIIFSRFT
jgi:Exonuclease VII, large subunit